MTDIKSSTNKTSAEEKTLNKALLSVTQARNLDTIESEIKPGETPAKIQTTYIKDRVIDRPDVDIRPIKPAPFQIARKNLIASSLIRFPLLSRRTTKVSTFTPTLLNYYEVIHYMDNLMCDNIYFEKEAPLWHPFMSRLYFGALAYIQTLRAMDYAKIGSRTTRTLTSQTLKDLPPERLPIPGPLVPMLKSICCSSPGDETYRLVCPSIDDSPGPFESNELYPREAAMLGMPNMPLLAGLANSILIADPNNVPDYTNPDSFSQERDITLSGYTFERQHWDQHDRNLLCQPGLHKTPETNEEIDSQFATYGSTLAIPVLDDTTPRHYLGDFALLDDIEWIENLIPTMPNYCRHFKDSSNLGVCSPYGPLTPLVVNRMTNMSSHTSADNVIHTLTAAFPDIYPYDLTYCQKSFEITIPQPYALMAQYSCINATCSTNGMNDWSRINIPHHGREGPYWTQNPINMAIAKDKGFYEVENIITSEYFIPSPD